MAKNNKNKQLSPETLPPGSVAQPPPSLAISPDPESLSSLANAGAPTLPGGENWREKTGFWFGIVGTVVGIISTILALYFYESSKIMPLLTVGVHPLKTELQRPDYDNELGFTYKGKPLESESVTSVQMSIWNAGTRSIKNTDILDPIRLVTPDKAAILSVRIKKTSRPICAFELVDNQENYKSGICHIKWLILEPSDGAVIQIIYAGGARRDPTLEGAVEGQRDGIVVERYDLTLDRKSVISSDVSLYRLVPLSGSLSAAILLLVIAMKIHSKTEAARRLAEERTAAEKHLAELRKRKLPAPPEFWIPFLGGLVFLLGTIGLLLFGPRSGPPFGW